MQCAVPYNAQQLEWTHLSCDGVSLGKPFLTFTPHSEEVGCKLYCADAFLELSRKLNITHNVTENDTQTEAMCSSPLQARVHVPGRCSAAGQGQGPPALGKGPALAWKTSQKQLSCGHVPGHHLCSSYLRVPAKQPKARCNHSAKHEHASLIRRGLEVPLHLAKTKQKIRNAMLIQQVACPKLLSNKMWSSRM